MKPLPDPEAMALEFTEVYSGLHASERWAIYGQVLLAIRADREAICKAVEKMKSKGMKQRSGADVCDDLLDILRPLR